MKTAKPYPDYPLFYHQTGQWAKKVRGKMHYFGVDPDAALTRWLEQKDYLLAGRIHPQHGTGLTVRELANRFLNSKKLLMDAGELSPRSWGHYYTTCENLVEQFGKSRSVSDLTGADLEQLRAALAKTRGPHALSGEVQRTRTILKYAWDEGLIEKPVRLGSGFKKPSKQVMRKARHATGSRMIQADELRKLIEAAGVPLKAMILLGINCGFGQSDVAGLPLSALDLDAGRLDFPRPKTHIGRRIPLWPETVAALAAAIDARPDPKADADAGLVFLTRFGKRWVRMKSKQDESGMEKAAIHIDAVQLEFGKLLKALDLKRKGLGFYALRHTFRTVADGAKDQPAADHIMGHIDPSMSAVYRESISDDRLMAVVKAVHNWLFAEE